MKCSKRGKVIKFFIFLEIYSSICTAVVSDDRKSVSNIAVIGAGPSGLVSAKYSIEHGYNVTVFEQVEELGGLWVYTDEVGKNKYGLNVHSALYNDLRANGPVQLMEYPGHYYPNNSIPFPPRKDVLKYIQSYANRFELQKYIKFRHSVVRVLPIENEKWEIIFKDLQNDRFFTRTFDAVFVCNGHFFKPKLPHIDGASDFKGKISHSHDFRVTEAFCGENVLIIGAGISGVDITILLANVANRITLSRKQKSNETEEDFQKHQKLLPPGVTLRGIVKKITADGADFIDGTHESFTAIIYATGYKYSYPFLSVDSGIHVDDNFVQPLYKHVINIEHPTMAFIGIPQSSLNYYTYDIQARFALKFISGDKKLPPKDDMLRDWQIQTENQRKRGNPKHKTHSLIFVQKDYYSQLSNVADIEGVPDFLDDMALDAINDLITKPTEFRKYKFTVNYNNQTFTKVRYED